LQTIADYHLQVWPTYRTFLNQLTATDLDQTLSGGRTRTLGRAVGHIVEHESYHLGKCMLLRNLLPSRRNR
jgi:uncharacterized damage-inducible protein DinB